jgi:hypothetical protein
VRAIAGSLVLSAALAPHALGQGSPAQQTPDSERIRKEGQVEKFPKINTKPFTDLLLRAQALRDTGQLDLSGNLKMEVEGERLEDGRLSNVSITSAAASSPQLLGLARDFLGAVSDGKLLAPLKGVHRLKMKLALDDKDLSMTMLTEMPSELEASNMASRYTSLIFLGAFSKKGKDEEAIYKSIRIAAEGRQVMLSFNMPRALAGDLLSRLMKRQQQATTPISQN